MYTNAIMNAENRAAQLRRDLESAEADCRAALFEQVLLNIKEGRLIYAIKELRSLPEDGTISLRDSKDIIEFISNNFNPK